MLHTLIDIILHLDKHLNYWAGQLGGWLYGLLFLIIFAETGLVVTPFLPGDSLLFAVGALSHTPGSPINLPGIAVLLCAAAVLGDAANYAIGKKIGPAVFKSEHSRFFKKAHLLKAHEFYEKYGGKTIIIARFVPIIRTFAPFVAGVAQMSYLKFAIYNVTGGIAWCLGFLFAGYLFGGIEWVQTHFSIITVAIIVISMLPLLIELLRARRAARKSDDVPRPNKPGKPIVMEELGDRSMM
jgi:membrane-associated protein